MSGLRCQVCGGPADRTADGVLWVVDAEPYELLPGAELTAHPPVCRPCARRSVRSCPHLGRASVALRVRSFAPHGVNGVLYRPTGSGPKAVDVQVFGFADPCLPWVLAGQLVMRLTEFTVVELIGSRA
jgi:hypothetical protein